ncbi:hypothetical protein PSPO01_11420 [Paraphaeosphaeria sporulosa]
MDTTFVLNISGWMFVSFDTLASPKLTLFQLYPTRVVLSQSLLFAPSHVDPTAPPAHLASSQNLLTKQRPDFESRHRGTSLVAPRAPLCGHRRINLGTQPRSL